MKIMHITKKYPAALGGDAVVVANLQKEQQALGDKVVIVTSNCDEIKAGKHIYKFGLKDDPAKLDFITVRRLVSLCMLFWYVFFILAKERPDVVHTHSVDLAFVVALAVHLFRIPLVHTFHIVTFYDEEQPVIRKKAELLLAKSAVPHCVTAPNSYDVGRLRQAGLLQTVLLPNGVDIDFWRVKNQKHADFLFVAVGRLESQKGYLFLLDAVWELQQLSKQRFKVIIIGEGTQRNALEQRIEHLKLQHVVSLVGRKSPEQVRAFFAQADVAVFPSLYETTPLTLLEAWAAAVPVITTSVGIVRDAPLDFDAAYIVPPKDSHELMQAMQQSMLDIDYRRRVAHKGLWQAKKYAWSSIAQNVQMIYRSAQ